MHVAIIMDGNGRWASSKGLSRSEGHKAGADAVDNTIQACIKVGIPVLSLYAFSTENWNRPEKEVKSLFDLLNIYIKRKLSVMIKNGISLKVSGDISRLPAKSRQLLMDAVEKTDTKTGKASQPSKLLLNICLNYGSRDEVLTAFEKIIKNRISQGNISKISQKPSWSEVEENLFTHGLPDVDLLIRTAGEKRLSNFMLLQAAYAELYFTDINWPDFKENELLKAVGEFQRRTRKFGGLVNTEVKGKANE